MGGKLDLESKIGEGTTFFFTVDFEEVETLNESSHGNYSSLKALILSDAHKTKRQDKNLREYLDYYGVTYATFNDISKVKLLSQDTNYNLLFVDYDYTNEDTLREFSELPQQLIVLTKSNLMKRIDSLGLDIYKILYEPIHTSKIKQTLENYVTLHATQHVAKKGPRKKFDLEKSKFVANVLVAEDNVINQKLIKRTLEDLGLNVTIANNGLEAFQKRKDGKFDLIFMDIQMPFIDGVEATAEILEWEQDYKRPHVPIVALTANALKGDRERFLAAGLDEYTTKPLVRTEIISVLNMFLFDFIVEAEQEQTNHQPVLPHAESVQEILIEKIDAAAQHHTIASEYRADILLAKKSVFETKLYAKVIESMGGLTYEVASSVVDFQELINNYSYKVVLLDKEYNDLDVAGVVGDIRKLSDANNLNSYVVLVDDSIQKNSGQFADVVDEIISNVVTRDMLKSLFEKHTK